MATALCGGTAQAQPAAQPSVKPDTEAQRRLPIQFQARELRGKTDQDVIAEGDAELIQGTTTINADRLEYNQTTGVARGVGNVHIKRDGNVFTGPEVQIQIERYEGFFLSPAYHFALTDAGGRASRIDFLGERRLAASDATYTSCQPDDEGEYAWIMQADSVKLDFNTNEGQASGAVLRFYGVPILASPYLTFPLSDERKSGWLPPTLDISNKSGLDVSVPYYWNIAPNFDATLTPTVMTKRGAALGTEVRYLLPQHQGRLNLELLPDDRVAGTERHSLRYRQFGDLPSEGSYRLGINRVSDDEYWKDFERHIDSITPRLLASDAQANWWRSDWQFYARAQSWQVLQDPTAPIAAPYARAPQLGVRSERMVAGGLLLSLETEANRFVLTDHADFGRSDGNRFHALGSLAWPLISTPGWFVTPKIAFNAASYRMDEATPGVRQDASRVIPTFSLDSGWIFERESEWFGRGYLQTVEPRVLYANTPFREQFDLPNFDSAIKDLSFTTLYDPNPFSGVDRVADGNQVTVGAITRFLDQETGAEALSLGLAQRYLLRDQRITPDGVPITRRFSDVYALGSTSVIPHWTLSTTVQFNPEIDRTVRSTAGVRYSPGTFRTVNLTYSYTRNASEQIDLAWQWPLYRGANYRGSDAVVPASAQAAANGGRPSAQGNSCSGSWYSVGRINYSMQDERVTDLLMGLEYDSGCWIGRLVALRRSTGVSEATTRLMFQIEFVGLSRLGSNPLSALKDNIPGYQLLREDASRP